FIISIEAKLFTIIKSKPTQLIKTIKKTNILKLPVLPKTKRYPFKYAEINKSTDKKSNFAQYKIKTICFMVKKYVHADIIKYTNN
uniref:hypothetical protein n=1 Tax=Enterocloster aldenensis TaxID=358742 RepID=UPI003567F0E4